MSISKKGQTIISDQSEIISRSEQDLLELHGKSVLISGGTGFIGKWLLSSFIGACELLGIELKVYVISRNPQRFLEANPEFARSEIEFIQSDVATLSPSRNYNFKVDYLINGATEVATNPRTVRLDESLNTGVFGTLNVMRTAISQGCKRVLNLSSGAVYGAQPFDMTSISESYDGAPNLFDVSTSYHHIKRMSEFIANSEGASAGLEVVTARLFTFIGPYLPSHGQFAAGNFLDAASRGRQLEINGDGKPIRTFQYPVDTVVALLGLLVRGKPFSAYNVGSSQEISIGDFASLVTEIAGVRLAPKIHGVSQTNLAGFRYVPDITKVTRDLNFKNEINLDIAVQRTLAWLNNT